LTEYQIKAAFLFKGINCEMFGLDIPGESNQHNTSKEGFFMAFR
jgi:hypothetical protein